MQTTASYIIYANAGRTADEAIKELNNNYQNYKLIEQELQQSRIRLLAKIPEIQKALTAVDMLISKQEEGKEVCKPIFGMT